MSSFKPYDQEGVLQRKELALYLNKLGRGVNCRLDVPVLTMEDIKWAATVFEKLAKDLGQLAFTDNRNEIYRILGARNLMEDARRELAIKNHQKDANGMAKMNFFNSRR